MGDPLEFLNLSCGKYGPHNALKNIKLEQQQMRGITEFH